MKRPKATGSTEAGASFDASVQVPALAPGAMSQLPAEIQALSKFTGAQSQETVYALSQCRCATPTTVELFKGYAVSEGVLSQFLVPRVRETIRGNNALKAVLNLPGLLKEVLKNAFANDQALARQVRENLSKKIAKVSEKQLKDDIDFRFDHYLTGKGGDAFAVQDLVARWNLVFSVPNLWKDGKHLAYGHHGLQVLETARSLSEWKYFFALDKDSKGGYYGGLTFETAEPTGTTLVRLDPREEPEARRTVSGTYSLQIPDNISAVQLVTETREKWARKAEAPLLLEQAMMWNAAAQAFTRLRVDKRAKHVEGLYGTTDDFLLPVESHKLPLIFLSGVQGQLQEIFLDKETRAVLNKNDPADVINLRVMSRLGRALFSWVSVLTDLEKAGLEPNQLERLKDVPAKMKDGLRLVILNILKERKLIDNQKESIADLLEAIALIVESEQNLLPSPHLKAEAMEAFRHVLVLRVLPSWEGKSPHKLAAEELLWLYTAASAVNKYPAEEHKVPWLRDMIVTLEGSLGPRDAFPWE